MKAQLRRLIQMKFPVINIVAAIMATFCFWPGAASATASQTKPLPAGVPARAILLAHSVHTAANGPCSGAGEPCTGTVTYDAYVIPGPTAAPAGAKVFDVKAEIAAENRRGANHHPTRMKVGVRPASGCTLGCGYWNFGCPGTFYESVKWDEQDSIGEPLYHQQQDNEDGVNCKDAWSIWIDTNHCQTYQLWWACVYPIPRGNFWDGSWRVDWSNTEFHFEPPIPFDCEDDILELRNNTGPQGGVWGRAYSPNISQC